MLWTKGGHSQLQMIQLTSGYQGTCPKRFESLPFLREKNGNFLRSDCSWKCFRLFSCEESPLLSPQCHTVEWNTIGLGSCTWGGLCGSLLFDKDIFEQQAKAIFGEKSVKSLWFRWNPPATSIGKIYSYLVYKWYILPIGWLYIYIYITCYPLVGTRFPSHWNEVTTFPSSNSSTYNRPGAWDLPTVPLFLCTGR